MGFFHDLKTTRGRGIALAWQEGTLTADDLADLIHDVSATLDRALMARPNPRALDTTEAHGDTTTLRVGDPVMWKGSWNTQPAERAVVTGLQVTDHPREKYGEEVESVSWALVDANRVLFSLDNGHWAYGDQISRMAEEGT